MGRKFAIEGREYDADTVSDTARALFQQLLFAQLHAQLCNLLLRVVQFVL